MTWVGRPGSLGEVAGRVGEIWDLDGVAASYRAFLHRVRSELADTTEDRFAALVRLVHEWRHFPSIDPTLPSPLLPARWPAAEAAELFQARRALWSPDAWDWWRAAESR